MAYPARKQHEPARRHGGHDAAGWASHHRAMITQAEAVALSVREMAARPGDPAALEMARLCLAALQAEGEISRRWYYDEEVHEQDTQRRIDQALAAHGVRRCHLAPVPAQD